MPADTTLLPTSREGVTTDLVESYWRDIRNYDSEYDDTPPKMDRICGELSTRRLCFGPGAPCRKEALDARAHPSISDGDAETSEEVPGVSQESGTGSSSSSDES